MGSYAHMRSFSPMNVGNVGRTGSTRVGASAHSAMGTRTGMAGNRSALTQSGAARSGSMFAAGNASTTRAIGGGLANNSNNHALNSVVQANHAAAASQSLNNLGNGQGGFGSRHFNFWGANSLNNGFGNGLGLGFGGYGNRGFGFGNNGFGFGNGGFGFGNGFYNNGNGIYVLVFIPNVGWVLMPLRVVMQMMGMGGGFGGMGGLGGFGGMGVGGMF